MSSRSRFDDRIDILDIIISILKDHEESLSNIVDRLEAVSKTFSSIEKKITKLDDNLRSQLDV